MKGYRETIRAVRMIGRDCIMKRIKAVEDGEEIPRDILSSILQIACESKRVSPQVCYSLVFVSLTATKESVDIEDLVDDFVIFYVAGERFVYTISSCRLELFKYIHRTRDN